MEYGYLNGWEKVSRHSKHYKCSLEVPQQIIRLVDNSSLWIDTTEDVLGFQTSSCTLRTSLN